MWSWLSKSGNPKKGCPGKWNHGRNPAVRILVVFLLTHTHIARKHGMEFNVPIYPDWVRMVGLLAIWQELASTETRYRGWMKALRTNG